MVVMSCDPTKSPCLEPRTPILRLGAYKPADTGSAGVDTSLPAAFIGLIDTPGVFVYGAKSHLYSGVLSSIADSCRWFVQPDTANMGGRDTIVFYYNRDLQYLSTACGYTYFYSLYDIKTTKHSIDSAKVIVSDVTTEADIEHVKVFY